MTIATLALSELSLKTWFIEQATEWLQHKKQLSSQEDTNGKEIKR